MSNQPTPTASSPIKPPEEIASSVEPTLSAIELADQAATQLVNQLAPPANAVVPNLATHIDTARANAQLWQHTLRPQILQVLGGVVEFGNTFAQLYDPLIHEAQRIANGDGSANAPFKRHLAGLQNITKRTAVQAKLTVPQIKMYVMTVTTSSNNLLADRNAVAAQLAGDQAAVTTLRDTVDSRKHDLERKIILAVFFPFIIGIIEGIKHAIGDAVRDLHNAQDNLQATEQEVATLTALQTGLAGFLVATHTLGISLTALAEGWDNLDAQFNTLMQSEQIADAGLWTPELLDTARRNWVDFRDLATILSRGIHRWPINGDSLLFYDKAAGSSCIYRMGPMGMIVQKFTHDGWRKDWALLSVGNFIQRPQEQIALYDPLQGDIDVVCFSLEGDAVAVDYQNPTLSKEWEVMLAGDFLGSSCTQLILYAPAAGRLDLLGFDQTGKLAMQVQPLQWDISAQNINTAHPTRVQLLAGKFLGNGQSQLLAFDSSKDELHLIGFDGAGQANMQVASTELLGKADWEACGVGDFLGKAFDQVLFYSRTQGIMRLGSFDADNQLVLQAPLRTRQSWKLYAVGQFLGNGREQMAVYDRMRGWIYMVSFDETGSRELTGDSECGSKWDSMIAGQFMGDGLCQVLLCDRNTGDAQVSGFDRHGRIDRGALMASSGFRDWTMMRIGRFFLPSAA